MTSPVIIGPDMFVRVKDHNGYLRSICRTCFLTAALSRSEVELERMERLHVCSGVVGIAKKAPAAPGTSSPR